MGDVEERGQETASPPVAPQLEGRDEEGEHAGCLRLFQVQDLRRARGGRRGPSRSTMSGSGEEKIPLDPAIRVNVRYI